MVSPAVLLHLQDLSTGLSLTFCVQTSCFLCGGGLLGGWRRREGRGRGCLPGCFLGRYEPFKSLKIHFQSQNMTYLKYSDFLLRSSQL